MLCRELSNTHRTPCSPPPAPGLLRFATPGRQLQPSWPLYASGNDECVDVCPLGTYESGGTCANVCVGERSYVNLTDNGAGSCVADCRNLSPPRFNIVSHIGYRDECGDECDQSSGYPYNDNGTCASSCPAERPYIYTGGICVDDCTTPYPPLFNPVEGQYYCVDDCLDLHYHLDEGTCVTSCPSQRPYANPSSANNWHWVPFGTCVADCRLLNPARNNSQIGVYRCVDDCSGTHYDMDVGTCARSCPSQRPYVHSIGENDPPVKLCVADCRLLNPARFNLPFGYYECVDDCGYIDYNIDEGTCVDSCPSQRPYVNSSMGGSYGTCVADCRLLNPARITAPTAYPYPQCVDRCSDSHFDIDEGTCVDSCPSQRPYVNSSMGGSYGTCVADCRLLNPARINAPTAYPYPQCVDRCSDSHFDIDGGACVTSCPSQRPYINRSMEGPHGTCVADCRLLKPARLNAWINGYLQCVDDCGVGHYDTDEGMCADSCPSHRPYENPYVDINSTPIYPIKCVANCSALSPPRVLALNYYRMECRDNCSGFTVTSGTAYISWEYAGKCEATCPEARPWKSTDSVDIPRQCVANCSELVPARIRPSTGNICVTGCRFSDEYIDSGVCVAQCPVERPYFTNDTWECTASCDELDPPRVLDAAGTWCVASCPPDHYVLNGKCSYNCEGSTWYEDEVSGTCVADCRDLVPPRLNTVNSTSPIRHRCEDACLSGFNLNGDCVTTCPSGYTADIGANRCVNACGDHCVTCASATICSSCEASVGTRYYAQGGVCSETCVSGTLKLIRDHVGSCVIDCPDGTYQVGQDRCDSCHTSCHTCTDLAATSCTSCNGKTRHLTLDGRCELHLAPGGLCDSTKYPSSQDCAYACLDGVCCAAPVPWCTRCAVGTGKCSACAAGKPLRNGLCGTLIGEDVFNFTAPPATGPPSSLWAPVTEDDDRSPGVASGAVMRCVWGSIAWAVIHSFVTMP
jgi:hypothetical protein